MGRIGVARLLPDDRLAQRAAAGDERALAAIFDRYHQDLYRFSLAIVGSPADAQDALQNTMVKVLRALPGERREIELKPWLYRIAHNESVELLRRRRPVEQLDPEQASSGVSLAEDAESRARLRRLLADLDQLPERQRGALVMRELGGLGFDEIGAALGTSAATARQTLYEARQGLRQMDAGREMDCDAVTRVLSDADGRVARRRDIRSHLRACPDCRRFREEIAGRSEDLGALAPLPALAATGLLQGLLGGAAAGSGGAGAGGGLAGAAAGGAAKSLGAGVAIKSAAAVAVVAVVGAGAADRGGIVDVTPWGGGSQPRGESGAAAGPDSGGPAGPGATEAGDALDGLGAKAKHAIAPGQGVRRGSSPGRPQPAAGGPAAGRAEAPNGEEAVPGGGGSHPHGRGHEKRHPEAASHGQQKAAENKAAGKGQGRTEKGRSSEKQAQPPQATKPAAPLAPGKPDKPIQPSKPEQSGGGAANSSPKAPSDPAAAHPSPSPQGEAKGNPRMPEGVAALAG